MPKDTADSIDSGVTVEEEEETPGADAGTESEEKSEETSEESKGEEKAEGEESDEGKEGSEEDKKAELTDRGTKKSPIEDSAFVQDLKNKLGDAYQLLRDPKLLTQYLRSMEGSQAPEKGTDDDLQALVDSTKDAEGNVDVLKLTKALDERQDKKIKEGISYLREDSARTTELKRVYFEDLSEQRKAHPELDPKSDKFDAELEPVIRDLFLARGGLTGKVGMGQVINDFYKTVERYRGQGRSEAETEVVKKRSGGIPANTPPSKEGGSGDEESQDPATILSSRVRKAASSFKG